MNKMRRKEFNIAEQYPEDVEQFLHNSSYGFLALQDDKLYPTVVPLNYVYYEGAIYFHGSKAGEKVKALKSQKNVTFAIAEEMAIIPSYVSDEYLACPATSYFKSVIIYGEAVIVDDYNEKCEVLQAFMEKLQPEGRHTPITSEQSLYTSHVKATHIVKINIDHYAAKFKFGQNLKGDKHNRVKEHLQSSNEQSSKEAAQLMARYCPYANPKTE